MKFNLAVFFEGTYVCITFQAFSTPSVMALWWLSVALLYAIQDFTIVTICGHWKNIIIFGSAIICDVWHGHSFFHIWMNFAEGVCMGIIVFGAVKMFHKSKAG